MRPLPPKQPLQITINTTKEDATCVVAVLSDWLDDNPHLTFVRTTVENFKFMLEQQVQRGVVPKIDYVKLHQSQNQQS